MEKISNSAELKQAILRLEIKQGEDARLLKEQFLKTSESLKPVNLIKNSIKEMVATTNIKGGLLKVAINLASTYFLKTPISSSSNSPVKKLFQALLGALTK